MRSRRGSYFGIAVLVSATALTLFGCGEETPFEGGKVKGANAPAADSGDPDPDLGQEAGPTQGVAELSELYRGAADMFCPGRGFGCEGTPTDLDFNPARPGELWVVFRAQYDGEPCSELGADETAGPEQAGCSLLRSQVAIFDDATRAEPAVQLKEDGNSWHFMRRATGLAFGDDDTFATVGEAHTGNWLDSPVEFMGPTWWSADPEIFAQTFTTTNSRGESVTLNGSHLDMLHATPFGMGVAHQWDAVYWCFNGRYGSVDRYDFVHPHEPGGADHSDGLYHRFLEGEVLRVPDVPSHMVFAPDETTLYVVDTGHQRVIALDTETGTVGERLSVADNQLADPRRVDGAVFEEIVRPGVLSQPSGIALLDGDLIVSDAADGSLTRFSTSGRLKARVDTRLGSDALAGIATGPDGYLYLVDRARAAVLRLESGL